MLISLIAQVADLIGELAAGDFVGKTSDADDAPRIPWVHLDIAGSAWHKGSPYGYTDKGATGASVRSLINLVTRNA